MQLRFALLYVMLVAFGSMGAGGCVSRDVSRHTSFIADYSRHLDKRKANLSTTDDRLEPLPDMTAADYERVGDQHFLKNDMPMAFVHYNKALRMSPDKVNLKYKLGLVFLKRGRTEEARKVFQEILEEDDTFALAYEGMGQAFLMMRHIREAERWFRQAVTLDASQWKSHNFLGMIYDHQKRFDDAIAAYQAAIALEENNALLLNNLGVSFYKQGDYDRASEALYKASQTTSESAKIYNNLGLSLAKLGRYQEALSAFSKGGNQAKAYNNLGVIYLTERKFKEAAAAFIAAMALSPQYYTTASDNLRIAQQGLDAASPNADPLSMLPAEIGLHPAR